METPAPSVEAALDRAGTEYRAQEAAAQRGTQKQVEQLVAAENPTAMLQQLGNLTNEQLAGLLVGLGVLFLPKIDERLVYTAAEQAQLAAAAVPVLNKYFPNGGLPCELVLLGTAYVITAPKLASGGEASPDSGGAEPSTPAGPALKAVE